MKKKTAFFRILIGIIAGVALNILPMYVVQYTLQLPFFMDTIGSIFLAFALGGLPAIICATISQLVMCVIEQYSSLIILMYVVTVYGAIGIVCFFKKSLSTSESVFYTTLILFFISVLTVFEMCIVGGLVNALCIYVQNITGDQVQDNPATSYFQLDLLKTGISELPAYILSRLPGNLIERPLITIMGFGCHKLYKKILH